MDKRKEQINFSLFILISTTLCSQNNLTPIYCPSSSSDKWIVKGSSCGSTFGETDTGSLQMCSAPNCTLWSQFYPLQPFSTIYIKIKMEIKKCSSSNCKQVALLNIYTAKSCSDIAEINRHYSIPPTPLPLNSQAFQTSEFTIEVGDLNEAEGIFVVFQADGFCGEIKSYELFYFECLNTLTGLVNFPPKPAPNTTVGPLIINGSCVKNAITELGAPTPVMMCSSNGNYTINGSCICDEGYEKIKQFCNGKKL